MRAAVFINILSSGLGKRSRPTVKATAAGSATNLHTGRLFPWDLIAGTKFLTDSGAEVSVIPPTPADRKQCSTSCFTATNNSSIPTFGQRSIMLYLGLRRTFRWVFADVSVALIGADFLTHFDLLVDLKNRRLVDSVMTLFLRDALFPPQLVPSLVTFPLDTNVPLSQQL
ncbi:unnamed protein product [Dibothriocephalus latus]|uniref:Peptidase A2 domain-containing protein n=1 Tax=Dibothriocephalus latus TaxID=60516 RepID=A0A3P7MFY3_DIBLA|nr:unnamed protein product [Dibothriocephalus latus]